MSQTVTTPQPAEPLITPQSIVAFMGMAIVGGTVAALIYQGDTALRGQVLGGVMAIGGAVMGYYFGSSKGSQAKDAMLASQAPTMTSTVTGPGGASTVTQPAPAAVVAPVQPSAPAPVPSVPPAAPPA